MRYLIVESGTDVSVYPSFELALSAIEPNDVDCMRLYDETGRRYFLRVGKRVRHFLGIWPVAVLTTVVDSDSNDAADELTGCLKSFASRINLRIPVNASLAELVELISTLTKKRFR